MRRRRWRRRRSEARRRKPGPRGSRKQKTISGPMVIHSLLFRCMFVNIFFLLWDSQVALLRKHLRLTEPHFVWEVNRERSVAKINISHSNIPLPSFEDPKYSIIRFFFLNLFLDLEQLWILKYSIRSHLMVYWSQSMISQQTHTSDDDRPTSVYFWTHLINTSINDVTCTPLWGQKRDSTTMYQGWWRKRKYSPSLALYSPPPVAWMIFLISSSSVIEPGSGLIK